MKVFAKVHEIKSWTHLVHRLAHQFCILVEDERLLAILKDHILSIFLAELFCEKGEQPRG